MCALAAPAEAVAKATPTEPPEEGVIDYAAPLRGRESPLGGVGGGVMLAVVATVHVAAVLLWS